jgi:hypothetical protein
MLFRWKDFHGGRAYDSDRSDKKKPRFGLRTSLVIGWVKLQLRRPTPVVLPSVTQDSEGFSLLGTDARHVRVHGSDVQVFPMAGRRADAASASEVV